MYKFKYLVILAAALVVSVNARPTIDLLYKVAQDIEHELTADTQTPSRDPYRGYGYGPVPPPVYHRGPQINYPGQNPSEIYQPPVVHSSIPVYPGQYPQYGPYPPQYGPYPSNNYNYIPNQPYPYDYQDQYGNHGNNGYGHVSGSNSYVYGSKSGYKNMGY